MASAAHTAAARPAVAPERVERELALFASHADAGRMGPARVERVEPYAFVVRPDGSTGPDIDLLLMALVHGNEVGGLFALNALCALMRNGLVAPGISVGMVVCNIAAARQGVRHVERDLNRSFGRPGVGTSEDRRARELEPLMRRARFCVDLHQTIEPSHTPFFVFGYEPQSMRFAHGIFPEVPVVTHWGRPFSLTPGGGCTGDEYIQREGGVAVSIELGQKGDDPYQIAVGVGVCLRAMALVTAEVRGEDALPALSDALNPIYTWAHLVPYPDSAVRLQPGLINFQPIEAGQTLGESADGAVRAPSSGYLLFPKYVHSELGPRPAELYRVLRRTHVGELGRGDCMSAPPERIT